jgi:hypothetical protein
MSDKDGKPVEPPKEGQGKEISYGVPEPDNKTSINSEDKEKKTRE